MADTAELRQQLLDIVAEAVDELAVALAALGDAYEQLDEDTADVLEDRIFRPVQTAYGRLQRAHAGFAARQRLPTRSFAPSTAQSLPTSARELVERAVTAITTADDVLSEMQDTLLPVEVGDREVRTDLAEVRQVLDVLPSRADELLRRLGR